MQKPFKRLLWRTLAALQTRQQQGGSVHHQIDPVRFVDPQRAFHAAANVALAEVQQTRDGGVRLHGLHQAHADDGKAGRCKERNGGVSRDGEIAAVVRAQLAQNGQRQGDAHRHKRGWRARLKRPGQQIRRSKHRHQHREIAYLRQQRKAVEQANHHAPERANDVFHDVGRRRVETAKQRAADAKDRDRRTAIRPRRENPDQATAQNDDESPQRRAGGGKRIAVENVAFCRAGLHLPKRRFCVVDSPGKTLALLQKRDSL